MVQIVYFAGLVSAFTLLASDSVALNFLDIVSVELPSGGGRVGAVYLGPHGDGHDILINTEKLSLPLLSDRTFDFYLSKELKGRNLEAALNMLQANIDLCVVLTVDGSSLSLTRRRGHSDGGGFALRAILRHLFYTHKHFEFLESCIDPYLRLDFKIDCNDIFYTVYKERFKELLRIVSTYWGNPHFHNGWKVLRQHINWATLHSVVALNKAVDTYVRILDKGAEVRLVEGKYAFFWAGKKCSINMDSYGLKHQGREKRDLDAIKYRI